MTRPIIGHLTGFKAVLAAATVGILPTAALAGHHDSDRFRGDECAPVIQERRVWVEPVYRTVCEQQWVPAVYRTVCDRVWVAPVFQKVCERVWVPDRYEKRRIIHENHLVTVERVLVECCHYEDRPREVVVTPGHFQDVQRQELVCDGHYQNVERQELVCAGHWETRCDEVAVRRYEEPEARLDLRLPFRW